MVDNTINYKRGSSSLDGFHKCNQFIETGRDHGLFYGSIKLSGYKKDVTGDGRLIITVEIDVKVR